jgi:hypothetical protein
MVIAINANQVDFDIIHFKFNLVDGP